MSAYAACLDEAAAAAAHTRPTQDTAHTAPAEPPPHTLSCPLPTAHCAPPPPAWCSPHAPALPLERERVSSTNLASTMLTMLASSPALHLADTSSLRVLSCGGSPQAPAVLARAVAALGCEVFLSYGEGEGWGGEGQ